MIIKNKSGQMEFIGLVIIVFLLSIGLITISVMKTQTPKKSVKLSYMDKALGQNTLNSMLNMRTECREGIRTGIKLSQLIRDCAETTRIVCDNGEDSCTYVNRTAGTLLNSTLQEWYKPYHFVIEGTDIIFSNMGCNEDVPSEEPGKLILPLKSNDRAVMMLRICKYADR